MAYTSQFIKNMNNYKKCMKLLNCTNYVYVDEISNFEFKKISKYNKSKNLYDKIISDFKLVNYLIEKKDFFNASTILRTLYENIIYIIAKSYDKTIVITLNTSPRELRKVLEDNCEKIFTEFFEKEDFNDIYKQLCKFVHPCSLKELLSYMMKTVKYKKYLLCNLKYTMIIIEYIFLNFLNKKVGNEESKFNLNLINLSTYVNLVNVSFFLYDVKDSKNFAKRYFLYDTNNKYIIENEEKLKEVYEIMNNEKNLIVTDIKELTSDLDAQIKDSKYKEKIVEMLR